MGFSECEDMIACYETSLRSNNESIKLSQVKFGNVGKLTIFIRENNGKIFYFHSKFKINFN